MSIGICVSDCYNSAFAGLFGGTCYCADDPSVAENFVTYPDADCDTPCPGVPSQSCGGYIIGSNQKKRQTAVAYTIYNNTDLVHGPVAVSSSSFSIGLSSMLSGGVTIESAGISSTTQSSTVSVALITLTSAPPGLSTVSSNASSDTATLAPEVGSLSSAGTLAPPLTFLPSTSHSITLRPTTIITTIFVDVCDVCEHGITTATTIITIMYCGCTESVDETGSTVPVPVPSVPMTTTVKTCYCGEGNAPSTTEVTVPCTSQIEEMSSSMASILVTAAPGVAAPAHAPAAEATGTGVSGAPAGGDSAPEAETTSRELLGMSEGESESTPVENVGTVAGDAAASEARSGDAPDITNSVAPGAGFPAENHDTSYATTKTIHLEPAESSTSAYGSIAVSAPRLAGPSPTKKSEGSTTIKRLIGFMATALFSVTVVMSLL